MSSVACVVLAAGGSTRMGAPKQLLRIGDVPLIRQVVTQVCLSRCDHIGVVLGAFASSVAAVLGDLRAVMLHNPSWSTGGLSSSIHVAVRWARASSADALLLTLGDQPLLTRDHVEALRARYEREHAAVGSLYTEKLGVPAIFPRTDFEQLAALQGDRGAAHILRRSPNAAFVPWPEGAVDLDTPTEAASFGAVFRLGAR